MKVDLNDLSKYANIYFRKENKLTFLTFFITSKCNGRCRHCFYWKELNKQEDELTLDEIEKVCRSIGSFDKLSITGGEPFLDPNLCQVTKIFYDVNHVKHLTIPTNGILTDRIVSSAKEILEHCPDLSFYISVSIDGLYETHDEIRGVPNSFEKALTTIEHLNDLKKRFPKLIVGTTTTLCSLNQSEIQEIYEFLKNKAGVETISINAIRGDAKDSTTKEFNGDYYSHIANLIKKNLLDRKLQSSAHLDWVSAIEMLRYDSINRSLNEGKYITPCYAGKFNAILYRNGDVFPCELLDCKFGNVRDASYDFNKILLSEEAESIRKFIKDSKCTCTHECMVNTNIIFNPRFLPQILLNLIKLKLLR